VQFLGNVTWIGFILGDETMSVLLHIMNRCKKESERTLGSKKIYLIETPFTLTPVHPHSVIALPAGRTNVWGSEI
jgi:hypothetical protein